jgi:dTDP-4-dehydrorhamnose 3,5-epimerase
LQTLTDHAEVLYSVSGAYDPSAERGIRYNDPVVDVHFPSEPTVMSERDRSWPLLET